MIIPSMKIPPSNVLDAFLWLRSYTTVLHFDATISFCGLIKPHFAHPTVPFQGKPFCNLFVLPIMLYITII